MATALASKETCFFVGGNGSKAGVAIAVRIKKETADVPTLGKAGKRIV